MSLHCSSESGSRSVGTISFKNHSAPSVGEYISLARGPLGTCHGLSKVPYMRDTRRSIGVGSFVLNVSSLSGPVSQTVGDIFFDRIELGAYDVDIHPISGCQYPSYMQQSYQILPFYIPLRSLTNVLIQNLLVAGKTIAQSFLANATTRLHPVEWSSGTAAGVVASYMAKNSVNNTATLLDSIHLPAVQAQVSKFTPISWYISGQYYPPNK